MEKLTLPRLDADAGLTFLWNYLVGHPHPRAALDAHASAFLARCLADFSRSRAQLFQDLYVAHRLRDKRSGWFVEFGAMDGITLSNTYYLETALGWNGIVAEPMPMWHAALAQNRRARIDRRCVWWESGKTLDFVASNKYPELSSIAEFAQDDYQAAQRAVDATTISVDTVSLNDLLAEHGAPRDIDYLSIDTEGSELDILAAFDFERFRVSVITVEHNFREDVRASLHQLLGAHGFVRELELFSRFDDWYVHPARVAQA
ncbi:MAG TPA: FkbM family methyltransferase [Burkholderiales bacterium]|nr:FkbM family methyltransferase [Burkholderiales bacterium]